MRKIVRKMICDCCGMEFEWGETINVYMPFIDKKFDLCENCNDIHNVHMMKYYECRISNFVNKEGNDDCEV